MKTYESFTNWYDDQSAPDKPPIDALRDLVKKAAPALIESSKWGNGVWLKGHLPILFIHTKPDHLQFGFFAGATLEDPEGLLRGKAKYVRHIRVETVEDIDHAVFKRLIQEASQAPPYR